MDDTGKLRWPRRHGGKISAEASQRRHLELVTDQWLAGTSRPRCRGAPGWCLGPANDGRARARFRAAAGSCLPAHALSVKDGHLRHARHAHASTACAR